MTEIIDWVARLGLQAHPEGGYYRRVYTDARAVPTLAGNRPLATSIHYLLTRESPVGRLHRNRSVILHYLQDGGPVEYVLLPAPGQYRRVVLGHGSDEQVFLEVPGGCWKASHLGESATHALISEVVIPGFDGNDHEFMGLDVLRRDYPTVAVELLSLLHTHV